MPTKDSVYGSGEWLKAPTLLERGQVNGVDLTIKATGVGQTDDGENQVWITFNEISEKLGLNRTNFDTIAELTGQNDSDNWIGARINAYPHRLDKPYNGKTHGVRIRPVQTGVNAAQRLIGAAPGAKPPTATAMPADAQNARQAAAKAMQAANPAADRNGLGKLWVQALNQLFPGREQISLTAAEWKQVEQHFTGYSGDEMPPLEDEIPFD